MAEETTQTEETGMAALETLADQQLLKLPHQPSQRLTSMAALMQQAVVKTRLPVYG